MDKVPTGRELGSKVNPTDLITVGFISGIVALVLEEQPKDATHVPGDTWVQDLDEDGNVTGNPYMGPPTRMTVYTADEYFEFN